MSPAIWALLALWTGCEALGQLLFKLGVDRLSLNDDARGLEVLRQGLGSALLWAGIGVHVVEFGAWIAILGRLPLSTAFPLESISYVTVILASRLFLREKVSPRRWIGLGLMCSGIAVLGAG